MQLQEALSIIRQGLSGSQTVYRIVTATDLSPPVYLPLSITEKCTCGFPREIRDPRAHMRAKRRCVPPISNTGAEYSYTRPKHTSSTGAESSQPCLMRKSEVRTCTQCRGHV